MSYKLYDMTQLETRLDAWEALIAQKQVFQFNGIRTSIDYDTNDMSIQITGYYREDICYDLYLFLEKNEMIIVKIHKHDSAGISGNMLLEKLYSVSRTMGIDTVTLMDTSTIHDGKIQLGYYHILLHGISWYNSMGFYGETFARDTKYNKLQINRTLRDVVDCYHIRNILEDVLGQNYNRNMTVQQLFIELDWLVRRDVEQLKMYILIEYFIRELRLRYNQILTMNMKDTHLAKIYKTDYL